MEKPLVSPRRRERWEASSHHSNSEFLGRLVRRRQALWRERVFLKRKKIAPRG